MLTYCIYGIDVYFCYLCGANNIIHVLLYWCTPFVDDMDTFSFKSFHVIHLLMHVFTDDIEGPAHKTKLCCSS